MCVAFCVLILYDRVISQGKRVPLLKAEFLLIPVEFQNEI